MSPVESGMGEDARWSASIALYASPRARAASIAARWGEMHVAQCRPPVGADAAPGLVGAATGAMAWTGGALAAWTAAAWTATGPGWTAAWTATACARCRSSEVLLVPIAAAADRVVAPGAAIAAAISALRRQSVQAGAGLTLTVPGGPLVQVGPWRGR